MKKILGITSATLVVLVLIGSFVVYPAAAASAARSQIIEGIATIAKGSGVKVSDVTVDVQGGNAISATTGGDKVGDITIRLGRIELEAGATSGATVGGGYDADSLRRQIEADLDRAAGEEFKL